MTEAIFLLRLEHHNMGELLNFMEQQLEQDSPVDLELLQNIVDYFADYPEQCHHPIENLIYRKLHAHDSTRAAAIGELLKDHKTIGDLTRRVANSLKEAEDGDDTQTTELRELMRQFIDHYRAHINSEETEFFPMALDTLTENDWGLIEFDLFDRKDPLFDHKVETRFRMLGDKIRKLAGRFDRGGEFRQQSKQLGQLTNIQTFNDMMENAGHDYRIVQHPEGAYGLERSGKAVIDIPSCSPSRAAWCAYYYVEAATGRVMSA